MSKVSAFIKDESGATAIEYGLIAAGISVVIIATVNAIGTTLNAKFQSVSTHRRLLFWRTLHGCWRKPSLSASTLSARC
jgi:pilus assembly protein Flp/PilA